MLPQRLAVRIRVANLRKIISELDEESRALIDRSGSKTQRRQANYKQRQIRIMGIMGTLKLMGQ